MIRALTALVLTAVALDATSLKDAVIGSQHDLTASGTGPVKSAEADACTFCHAPHNIVPNVTPLWDQTLSSQTYITYTSTTYTSGAETPASGSSKLCLSCHDGTVAVGLTVTKGLITTSGKMTPADNLGTNLSTSHPVSMTPVDDGSLVTSLFANPPSTRDPAVHLVGGKIECTTCHDPHMPANDPALPMFLVRSNASGTLCLACHDPGRTQPNWMYGWTGAAHATAGNTVPISAGFGPYGNVASDACSSCHNAHNNGVGPRSLKAFEETGCTPCHSGSNVSPALVNITAEYSKTYVHPTFTVSGAHDAAESLPVNTTRHAECPDCHNSHAASPQTGTALPPAVQAALTGVSGYDAITGALTWAANEYQVCYKCHADSNNKPTTSTYGRTASRYPSGPLPAGYPVPPPMPADQYNLRLKFMSTIGHNVMGNSVVTTANNSLRPYMLNVNGSNNTSRPLTTTTLLYCTDCHNNDQARSAQGTGPNGPHGSVYPHLLQFDLFQDAPGGGGGGGGNKGAALCNKCHNLSTVQNESIHDPHNGVGCTTCHDPHGVIGGTPGANRAMMNFDTAVAAKETTYFGYFYRGPLAGQKGCYTSCHGQKHNPQTY
jgi:predicted CXXCH cytochrome family protein